MSLFGGRGKDEASDSERAPRVPDAPLGAAPTVPVPGIPDLPTQSPTRSSAAAPSGGHEVTHVGPSVVLKGDLSGDEDLTIEGEVKGRIHLPKNQLTIGANGRIQAELDAKTVVVIGQVSGNIIASERVEIYDSGSVTGDIHTPRLLIHEGAVVNGTIDMSDPSAAEPAEQAPAPKKSKAAASSAAP